MSAARTRPPRVVIASELMYPELTSTGFYISAIARAVATVAPVSVICGQPTYAARGLRAPREEVWEGVHIHRCRGTTFDKNRMAGRLVNIVTLGVSAFMTALGMLRRGDVAIVVTNPPVLPALVAVACWWRGATCVPLIHDQYPELLVAVAKVDEGSIVVRLLQAANRRLFRVARRVVVVGRDQRTRLERTYPEAAGKVDVCPNWAEADTVTPAARDGQPLREALGLTEPFVVLYAGNLGRPQELATLVAGAERLAADPRFHLLVVGEGARREWLAETVRAKGLRNVTLLGPRPRHEQQQFLNACDLGLVTLVRGMWGVSVPSRLYNLLAAGKPILGVVEPESEVDLVIREEGVGWSTPPGDVDAFVAAVRDAASDRARLRDMGEKARAAADRAYAGPPSLRYYRTLATDLLSAGAAR